MAERGHSVPRDGRWTARIVGLTVAVAVLLAGLGYLQLHRQHQAERQRQLVNEVAAAQAFTLQQQLARSLSSTYALASVLRQFEVIPNFATLADDLIRSYGGISSLQLAPDGVVTTIHPLAGNERAIGHDLLHDPRRRAEALRAIDTGELVLAGPFELIQGGTAVVGRLPVFTAGRQFWGFAIALIRMQVLLQAADLDQLSRAGLDYVLWRDAPTEGGQQVFAGNLDGVPKEAQEVRFEVPNGQWILAVVPHDGWRDPPLPFEGLALVLLSAVVAGLLATTLVRLPAELRGEVAARRAELEQANHALRTEVGARALVEQALRRSEARLHQFIEYAGDAVLLHDAQGRILDVNREACRVLGHEREQLLSQSMSRIVSGFITESQQTARAGLQPGLATVFEDWLRRPHADPLPVELKIAAFDSQDGMVYVTFARDISTRLASQSVLARTRDELEARVEQRKDALEQANAELVAEIAERREAVEALRAAKETAEEAGAAKSRFLANLSHEIRAPMNGLLGMLHLLGDHPLPAEQHLQAVTAIESGNGLLRLLNDLLDLSRIEAGFMELDPVETELRPWLEMLIADLRERAVARGLTFDIRADPDLASWARFDATRLGQVIENLLDNAIKFTPEGTVSLHVEQQIEEAGSRLQVVVADTGVGIPEAAVARIFDSFAQVEETLTRRFGGPGLGLAISSRLVGIMGGRLEVESRDGEGSRFRFDVPLEVCAAPARAASREVDTGDGTPRVLVAEDDHPSQQVIMAMLRRLGCEADLAEDGPEAVAALENARFDLVLMDCRMPGLDGFEATRAIRQQESAGQHTPIVGLSGDIDSATVSACRDAGMDGHLGKPLRLEALRSTLVQWVPRWRQDQSG